MSIFKAWSSYCKVVPIGNMCRPLFSNVGCDHREKDAFFLVCSLFLRTIKNPFLAVTRKGLTQVVKLASRVPSARPFKMRTSRSEKPLEMRSASFLLWVLRFSKSHLRNATCVWCFNIRDVSAIKIWTCFGHFHPYLCYRHSLEDSLGVFEKI